MTRLLDRSRSECSFPHSYAVFEQSRLFSSLLGRAAYQTCDELFTIVDHHQDPKS